MKMPMWLLVMVLFWSGCAGQAMLWPGGSGDPPDPESALVAGQDLAAAGLVAEALVFLHQTALFGDAEQRRQAYVELYLLGAHLYDEVNGEQCQIIDLSLGCGQIIFGCANDAGQSGDDGGESYLQLAVGPNPEELVFDYNQVLRADVDQVALEIHGQCYADRCHERAYEALFTGDQCLELPSVQEEIEYCVEEEVACKEEEDEDCPDDEDGTRAAALATTCAVQACDLAGDAVYDALIDWPELREEAGEFADEACAECVEREVMKCKVVFANACTGQVATVCEHDGAEVEKLGGQRFQLNEDHEILIFETIIAGVETQ
ncbi:MAG: hypothetical protein ACNA8W_06270 [Bradymonadaceae bacterium]